MKKIPIRPLPVLITPHSSLITKNLMNDKEFNAYSRREFIRRAACAAVGTVAMTAAIRDLRFMNAAVAQSNVTDYKALVCIFLAGGNDEIGRAHV